MSSPEFIIHFAIGSIQRASNQLLSFAGDLPVGSGLNGFDVGQLQRALEAITEVLLYESLQCQSVFHDINATRTELRDPPFDLTLPSPPRECGVDSLHCEKDM
jgi:hypothetical protein